MPRWEERSPFRGKDLLTESRVMADPVTERLRAHFSKRGINYNADLSGDAITQLTTRVDSDQVTSPFTENAWVRSAIKALLGGIQRMPLGLWTGPTSDKESTMREGDHPFLKTLREPSPRYSGSELLERIVSAIKFGGAYLFFGKLDPDGIAQPVGSNRLTGRWTEAPDTVLCVPQKYVYESTSRGGWPEWFGYSFQEGPVRENDFSVRWDWPSVVKIADIDPDNLTRGSSDVGSAAGAIEVQHESWAYVYSAFRSGGNLGGVCTHKTQTTPDEAERSQQAMADRIDGVDDGGILLLYGDPTWSWNPHSPKDMEFGDAYDRALSEILAAIGVPPPVLGLFETATMNNVETAVRMMWQGPNGIIALAEKIERCFKEVVFRRAENVREWKGVAELYPRFDRSMIEELQEDQIEQITAAFAAAEKGLGVSLNESLELHGVDTEQLPTGDIHLAKTGSYADLDTGEPLIPPTEAELAAAAPPPPAGNQPPQAQQNRATSDKREDDRAFADAEAALARRLERTFEEYRRETIANLRRIANGGSLERRQSGEASVTFNIDEPTVIGALTDAQIDELLLSSAPWIAQLNQDTREILRDVFMGAAQQAHAQVGGPIVGRDSLRTQRFLYQRQIRVTEGVTSTLSKQLRETIARTLSNAQLPDGQTLRQSIEQSIDELGDALTQRISTEARAANIARTEVGIAHGGGKYEQYLESGVEEIQWITSSDEFVRDSHKGNNNVTRVIGDKFSNGLRYPLDPEGHISEIASCRCDFVATRRRRPD